MFIHGFKHMVAYKFWEDLFYVVANRDSMEGRRRSISKWIEREIITLIIAAVTHSRLIPVLIDVLIEVEAPPYRKLNEPF